MSPGGWSVLDSQGKPSPSTATFVELVGLMHRLATAS
jgi:hypothetical protein